MNGVETLARLERVEKRFGLTRALKGVSVQLPAGHIIGLIGPNGAGKSTLLRLLAGLQRPTAGRVEVFGQAPGLATKARVAYVPDSDFIDGWMTVEAAVAHMAEFYTDFSTDRAAELLKALELPASRHVWHLSRGQRQRLGLALAMARQTDLYLFDEPLAHIDPRSRRLIIDAVLTGHLPDGATLLLATHQIGEIERLLDYAIFLDSGHVVRAGEADALRAETGRSLLELAEEVGE